MTMDINKLSEQFLVKKIKDEDIREVYKLCGGNLRYYAYMNSGLTIENIRQDMQSLPPGKDETDKYYIGFYKEDVLIAIMDLILAYPNEQTAYIGLFMTRKEVHRTGTGTQIIHDVLSYLKKEGFTCIRLGCVKDNMEGRSFWLKNDFLPTGEEKETKNYTIVEMQRTISGL